MGNTFGTSFSVTTWGESHGDAVGVIVDGCPPGLAIDIDLIQTELDRRKPGQSEISTQRKEGDKAEILSGVFDGKTTGTPISMIIYTSGTTGKPKGVVREHGGVVLTVRAYLQQQGIRNDDIMMSVLSLGHANAQAMCLFTSIGAGATAVFFPRFSASNFFKWAHNCGATCVNMLGAVAEYLFSSKPSEYDQKHNIRIMLGSPAPRNLIDFHNIFLKNFSEKRISFNKTFRLLN